jgi:phosphatidylinositol-3,4,5-trisphosphate 3-phosphatase/dual-specificity protein phosphatase PTEN
MGYPAENVEGMYRNKMSDVVRFLDTKHPDHYKVYNLCSERVYDKCKFHGRVSHYPFEDHNAPPIELMRPFCEDVAEWLQSHPDNIVAIHCKAGKGRTGVMICAFLLHAGLHRTAEDALRFYGEARTKNSKGVTIPSQARYVGYYETLLRKQWTYVPRTLLLQAILLHTTPHFNKDHGCNPVFTIKMKNVKIYASKALVDPPLVGHREESTSTQQGTVVKMPLSYPLPVCGDIKVELFHKQPLTKEKMCHFWFNTFFVEGSSLMLTKDQIDKAQKDKNHKSFDDQFAIELLFQELTPNTTTTTVVGRSLNIQGTTMTLPPAPSSAVPSLPSSLSPHGSLKDATSESRLARVQTDLTDEDDFEYDVGDVADDDTVNNDDNNNFSGDLSDSRP